MKISEPLTVIDYGKAHTTAFTIERRKFKLRQDYCRHARCYVRIADHVFCLLTIKAD